MARREASAPQPLLLLLSASLLLLPAALAHAGEQTKTSLPPQRTNDDPLVTLLSQHVGPEHPSSKHAGEARHFDCQSPNPQQGLTCTANCPLCPACPSVQTCPSPCPTIPKCPEPHQCPTPCAACPTCPNYKKPIPPGYEHFSGHGYYRLHTVPVDWMTAKATCEREGAYLAIINSQEEANIVKKLFNRDPNVGRWLYLGFHDLYEEGKFVTLFGEPLSKTGYTTWSKGQPDNHHGNENCGSMQHEGGLNDLDCSAKEPFVCELSV